MTTEQRNTMVFKDQAGEYFLLPREVLERGHVAAEHKAEVERLVAEAEADDVSGHNFFIGLLVGAAISDSNRPLGPVIRAAVARMEG